MNEALQQLVETIKNLAPQVWAIYLRQVYNVAIADIIGVFIFAALSVIFYKLTALFWKKNKEDRYEFWDGLALFTGVGLVISVFFCGVNFVNSIMYLINPQYYAIQWLLDTVK